MLTAILKAVQDVVLTALKAVQDAEKNHPHKDQVQRLIPIRAQVEWYKVLFDYDIGYYDAFKQRRSPRKFHQANMCHIRLG
jgi:hypothetical protein